MEKYDINKVYTPIIINVHQSGMMSTSNKVYILTLGKPALKKISQRYLIMQRFKNFRILVSKKNSLKNGSILFLNRETY